MVRQQSRYRPGAALQPQALRTSMGDPRSMYSYDLAISLVGVHVAQRTFVPSHFSVSFHGISPPNNIFHHVSRAEMG